MSDQANQSAQITQQADSSQKQDQSVSVASAQAPAAVAAKGDVSSTQDQASDKTQGTDTTSAQASQKVVPEKYDLKLPENSLLTPEAVEKISLYAKEKGLSQEEAQALVERENSAVSSYAERQKQEYAEHAATWVETIKADKEIGGEQFNKSIEMAKRVVDKYADPEFKRVLNETGLGNHPELVRTFARIGRQMSEASFVKSSTHTSGTQKSHAERLYGSQSKED